MQQPITIGVIGHTGHGKTTLVRCLAGMADDCQRSVRPNIGAGESDIVPVESSVEQTNALIDLCVSSGRGRLKCMIRELCAVDAVIFVVAADDGVMPETIACLEICRCLNIRNGLVVLSKIDLVDRELLELAELEVKESLSSAGLSAMPMLPFSPTTPDTITEIRLQTERMARDISLQPADAEFRMWIDRVKSPAGIGTVVCGTVLSGKVVSGDRLVLLPEGRETIARSLEVHHRPVSSASAGQRVGINLRRVAFNEATVGMALSVPEAVSASRYINADIQVFHRLHDRQQLDLYVGTLATGVTVLLMQHATIEPASSGLAQLRFRDEVAVLPGDSFLLALPGEDTIIGQGTVLEISHSKYRVASADDTITYLLARKSGAIGDIIRAYLWKNRSRLVGEKELIDAIGPPETAIRTKLKAMLQRGDIVALGNSGLVLKAYFDKISEDILAVVKQQMIKNPLHPMIPQKVIKNAPTLTAEARLLDGVIAALIGDGRLYREGPYCTIAGFHCPLTKFQDRLASELLAYAEKMGTSPFSAGGFCKNTKGVFCKRDALDLLDYLCRQGKFVRLESEVFISVNAVQIIKQRVSKTIAARKTIHLTDSHEILGYGRSKGTLVFEYLDAIGFTERQGDVRVLKT